MKVNEDVVMVNVFKGMRFVMDKVSAVTVVMILLKLLNGWNSEITILDKKIMGSL